MVDKSALQWQHPALLLLRIALYLEWCDSLAQTRTFSSIQETRSPVCSCQWQPHMCGLRFHLQILLDSQDGLICEQQQKSMPASSALGEALGLSFSEAHEE